jgi:hypothetical protein
VSAAVAVTPRVPFLSLLDDGVPPNAALFAEIRKLQARMHTPGLKRADLLVDGPATRAPVPSVADIATTRRAAL